MKLLNEYSRTQNRYLLIPSPHRVPYFSLLITSVRAINLTTQTMIVDPIPLAGETKHKAQFLASQSDFCNGLD